MSTRAKDDLDCALKVAPPDARLRANERRTRWVVLLTFVTMIGELVVGYASNSLALTADGWHMGTHVAALGLSAGAYWFARTRAATSDFSFGTGKVHALAGYTSALLLALVALWMIVESLWRLFTPEDVHFAEALPVAVLGLVVNLASMKLLGAGNGHGHGHGHGHAPGPAAHEHDAHGHGEAPAHGGHDHGAHGGEAANSEKHQDHNLRAAYVHVVTDALTSVLAIAALLGGQYLGWVFLDAAMGIVGGSVIAHWSYGLCREAAKQLLDVVPAQSQLGPILSSFETRFPEARVVDLHVWDLGPNQRACIVSVVTDAPEPVTTYRDFLTAHHRLSHVTVEVHIGSSAPLSA